MAAAASMPPKQNTPIYSAFVSCSLRDEDRPAVDWVERLLRRYRIRPGGTVGRHRQSPEPLAVTMREQIARHDCVAIVATPRYQLVDARSRQTFLGMSEALHVEAGMAYAMDKPALIFVQRGVDVRSFIQGVSQYVVMPESDAEVASSGSLIHAYMMSARAKLHRLREAQNFENLKRVGIHALAAMGFVGMIHSVLAADDADADDDDDVDDDFGD